MAQFDFSTIEGYDTMSAEDKVNALTERLNAATDSSDKWKTQFDKAASEIAGYKKQMKATGDSNNSALSAKDDEIKSLTETVNALKRENNLSKLIGSYRGQGFDDELAKDTAEAMLDGNNDKVIENIAKFTAAQKAAWETDFMKGTPKPPAGNKAEGTGKNPTPILF